MPIRAVAQDAARFATAGVINTAITSCVYLAGILFMSPAVSYALAWLVGLLFVVWVYPDRVFVGGRRGRVDRLMLALCVIGVFVLGLVLLQVLISAGWGERISFAIVLCVTIATNFILNRALLRRP